LLNYGIFKEFTHQLRKIFIGLALMSLGGILLLINKFAQVGPTPTVYFMIAAVPFCLGYLYYALSFIGAATDSADETFRLG
jgi:hypothetical protein